MNMIYGVNACGLGDVLVCINNAIVIAQNCLRQITVSSWTIDDEMDREVLIREVIAYFRVEHLITLTKERATHNLQELPPGVKVWSIHRGPYTWGGDIYSGTICYQFDGVHRREDKAITENEWNLFAHTFKRFKLIKLGRELSVDQCGKYLSECRFFLGIDSGIAHLAYTVGCPIYLLRNDFFWDVAHDNGCRGRCPKQFNRMIDFLNWYQKGI